MIVNDKLRIAYFSVPKVACTSLKNIMFELEFGGDFDSLMSRPDEAEPLAIHKKYPSRLFRKVDHDAIRDYWKFAVVRDPIQRIISCYTEKVRDKQVLLVAENGAPLTAPLPEDLGDLDLQPGLDRFCRNLPRYRKASRAIFHHTRRFRAFLGPDLGYFDAVYRIEDLDKLCAALSERAGKPVALPHRNPSAKSHKPPRLRAGAYDHLRAFTEPDYELLAPLYSPPKRPRGPQRKGTARQEDRQNNEAAAPEVQASSKAT